MESSESTLLDIQCNCTSANSIPCGSRYRHMPWRWLSRKSSSRRNLTAHSERQSRQYTEISSSRDCKQSHTDIRDSIKAAETWMTL